LEFLHKYSDEKDIEVMGFVASVFAYGNVKQIINTLNRFVSLSENTPYEFIINYKQGINNIIHRFYSLKEVDDFFIILKDTNNEYTTFKDIFLKNYNSIDSKRKTAMSCLSKHLIKRNKLINTTNSIRLGTTFMFPLSGLGCACRRMYLFLRWIMRKGELGCSL